MNNRFLGCCFALPDLNNNNDIKTTPKRKEMEPLCLADSQMNTPSGFSAEINMAIRTKARVSERCPLLWFDGGESREGGVLDLAYSA